MTEDKIMLPHKLVLEERSKLTLTGVTEVISFDDSAVILRTELGKLMIHGKNLQLKTLSLDGGQVAVDGHIAAMIYEDPRPASGFFQKLFR